MRIKMTRYQLALVLFVVAFFTVQCGQKESLLDEGSSMSLALATVSDASLSASVPRLSATATSTEATTLSSSAQSVVSPSCIDGDSYSCSAEVSLVIYTNAIRSSHGLAPLTQDFQMSYVARDWSAKQGSLISHAGFPGDRITVYETRFGGDPASPPSAENVAFDGKISRDPASGAKAFADMWQQSSGHLANILGDYTKIGVGISCSNRYGCTGTQIFMP